MRYAVTGHRPNKLLGYGTEATFMLEEFAERTLKQVLVSPDDTLITGMALGWDQACAVAAIKLNIPFIAAVPFDGQQKAWPLQAQLKYENLLAAAAKVVIVSPGGYAVAKMQIRNAWMVDNSDILIALSDLSAGGTMNCINYAQIKKKLVLNVWNSFAKFKGEEHGVFSGS